MKRLCTLLVLTGLLLAGCGQAEKSPTPTELAPTATAVPIPTATAVPEPTATPTLVLTDTPVIEPTATPTLEPTPTATPAWVPYEPVFEEARCPFPLPPGQVQGETVRCGYLLVPEDRADPDTRTIHLAVAIFTPPGETEPDPILYLEGGPGGSALEHLDLVFDRLVEPLFPARREIILFDQRGVGFSEPALDCPGLNELSLELLDYELDGRQLDERELFDLVLETLVDCADDLRQVADLSDYNSVTNAADVNDLRVALGYDRVNLWGVSYGTRLALGVMRDFPDGLRSVVLDSVYPPDADLYLEIAPNAHRAFELLFDRCAADVACDAAYPDLRGVLFDTVDRLNETPASFQVTHPFTRETYDSLLNGDDLLGTLFQLLYDTQALPSLPRLVYEAQAEEFDTLALILSSLLAQQEALSRGMQLSVQCHEELIFSSLPQLEAVLQEYPDMAHMLENSIIGPMSYPVCESWGAGQAAARENEPISSDLPTLVMAGEFDPITPPAWGRHAAETLSNSLVFEYPGVGHGASLVAGCPNEMLLAFLDDPSTPPDDACISAMHALQFEVPSDSVEPVEFEPFANEEMGIRGLAPVGWTEVGPGVFTRSNTALDVASLIQQAAPVDAEFLLNLLSGQLGLDAPPESVGERVANDLTWSLYAAEIQGLQVDFALAEGEGLALIVLLQSSADQHDALYEVLFLPAVDALVPLE